MTVKNQDFGPTYIARVTTIFQFPEGEVDLAAGQPVVGLSASQAEMLLNLNFLEERTESGRLNP